jgi:hypothetical protein
MDGVAHNPLIDELVPGGKTTDPASATHSSACLIVNSKAGKVMF